MGETTAIGKPAWRVTLTLLTLLLGRLPTKPLMLWMRTTQNRMVEPKNALFDAIGEEIFARVHSKKTAHEVWEEFETIHVGSKKLREEKYQVLKEKLNEFKMHPSELVEQIYARLNVLIEDINALEISSLSTSDIIRKILHSLHKPKYNIVTSLLYEKDLSILQVSEVVGKIWSHEMFLMGEIEPPQAKGDLALKAKGEHKSNKKSKGKAPISSSSEVSDDSSDEEGDEDTKLALLMRNTTKLMSRLNKKGHNFDPRKTSPVQGSPKMLSRRYAMFVASMVIFHMIALKNQTRSKMRTINQGTRKIMITRRTMTIKSTRRRGPSRRKRRSRLSLGSGSPMARPQATTTTMMMMTPRM